MKRSYLFLATGFEETEAIGTVDVLRRAGMDVKTVSITGDLAVAGAHGIVVEADYVMAEVDFSDSDWLILPGGLPGATNLFDCNPLTELLVKHYNEGKHVAAICASPGVVLAPLGILKGHKATAYPGFDKALAENGAIPTGTRAVIDGNVVTGNGPSSVFVFGIAIVEAALGKDKAREVADGMLM